MQTSDLGKKKNNLPGDEECINFRPSPNFKHMRKYLKSKFEEANSSPNQNSDPSTTPNSEEQENVKPASSSSTMAQRVQPPLPPNSPPPELVVPKEEIVDDEYDKPEPSSPKAEDETSVKKDMCRQFIRGTCVRGAACIYAHEVILDQLPGVYTFCKNFQNKECKLLKCKFVHASVFEKEHFYRTGYLPPHTLQHLNLKEPNSALAPTTTLEVKHCPVEAPPMFPNPPPPIVPGLSSLPPVLKQNSPAKRDWSELDLAMAGQEHDSNEPILKKCKSCDVNELRLQVSKAKLEKLLKQIDMYKMQNLHIMKLENKLQHSFEQAMLHQNNNVSIANKLNSAITRNEDTVLDQLSMYLSMTSRSPADFDSAQKLILKQVLKELMNEKGNASPISR